MRQPLKMFCVIALVWILISPVAYGKDDVKHEDNRIDELFLTEAKQGDAEAQYMLGLRYYWGEGIAKDYAVAVKWYSKAAEQRHTEAQFSLALMYHFGKGVTPDYEKAYKWYSKAAEQGYAEAQNSVGCMYEGGQGLTQDYTEAVKWYSKAAERGLARGQSNLARMYYFGNDIAKDYAKAFKWWSKAAEQGLDEAQFGLGEMYDNGNGVAKDYAEAFKWWSKAAEQGYAIAQHNLGLMYAEGQKVAQDFKEAVKWYSKAAEQGYAGSQYNLGLMYNNGKGVSQDYTEAFKWYRKAAEQEDASAQHNLGLMYAKGQGATQDYKEAFKWWRKAAEHGNAEAQHALALVYHEGIGVIEDFTEAYKWTLLAGMNGYDVSEGKRTLKRQMTNSQIAEAQRLAREFKPKLGQKPKDKPEQSDNPSLISTGTGFFVSSNGYLITAYHVIENARQIKILTESGTISARLVTASVTDDIAILKVEGGDYSSLPLISSRGIRLGAEVFTIGFPNVSLQGFGPKFTKGSVSSLAGVQDDPRCFQISVPVQPGNSGGALLDEKGNVAGIIVSKLNDGKTYELTGDLPQNVNYALKSSFVLAFLEAIPEVTEGMKEPYTKKRDFIEVVEKAKKSVVLVLAY